MKKVVIVAGLIGIVSIGFSQDKTRETKTQEEKPKKVIVKEIKTQPNKKATKKQVVATPKSSQNKKTVERKEKAVRKED